MTTADSTVCAGHPPADARPVSTRAERLIRTGVALTVTALAVVAAASSFGHMKELAAQHGQHGWQSLTFPISVDGLELTATLVLFAEHRARGKATSLLPWLALAAGTAASIAANIAVGPPDLIGRAISGWPGIALIAALKLLTTTLTNRASAPPARPASALPTEPAPDPALRLPPDVNPELPALLTLSATESGTLAPAAADDPDDDPDAADDALVAASRKVRDRLAAAGQRLTRRELLAQLRAAGHAVSTNRAGELLRILNNEVKPPLNGAGPQPNGRTVTAPLNGRFPATLDQR